MLGRVFRMLFALTAIAPLSVSLAYVYAARENNIRLAIIAALACIALGGVAYWIIAEAGKRLEKLPISIKKARSADKEVIGFFVAYALPLVFRGEASIDLGAWMVAAAMLFFVLWTTHSLQVNPVLGLVGFHFYEVETADGITYLMITRRKISNVLTVESVVQLSEHGILEASTKR